jgi:beta-lactamase class D
MIMVKMNLVRALLLFLACAVLTGHSNASPADPARPALSASSAVPAKNPDLDPGRFFKDVEGTFVFLDFHAGRTLRHNPPRAGKRLLPASTYKIPNTLIALETGVASGPDFSITRDAEFAPSQPWWPAAWKRDHTLRTALANSVIWYYQELARRIGPARMQAYVDQFGYGNREISGGIDQFWLSGGLRISAEEQVNFLRRFYFGELGVSQRATRVAKELLVLEETPAYRLSGKTGWAGLGDPAAAQIGWLVGYLERDGKVHFFATNIDIKKSEDAARRLSITKAIFRDLGLIEG